MLAETSLDPQEALVCTMVLVAAAGEAMTDSEIGVMSGLVQTLPVVRGFSADRLAGATDRAVELLRETDGLAHAGRLIRDSLPPRLRETAYALACEVAAADFFQDRTSVTILEAVRDELALDPLVASAIERGARARYQVV
jgi:tellurite resistance protein